MNKNAVYSINFIFQVHAHLRMRVDNKMYDVFLFCLPFHVRLKIRPLFEVLEAHGSNSTAFYLLLVTVAMTTAAQSQQSVVFAARQAMRILKTIRIHAAVKCSCLFRLHGANL